MSFFERNRLEIAASFIATLMPSMVNEDAAHRLRRERVKMVPILDVYISILEKFNKRFMDQPGYLKRVIGALLSEICRRPPAQVGIDIFGYLVECFRVAFAPFAEEPRNFRWSLCPIFHYADCST